MSILHKDKSRPRGFNDVSGGMHVHQHMLGGAGGGSGFFQENPVQRAMRILSKQTRDSLPGVELKEDLGLGKRPK
ncbi:MAG TPA: hypothetical protein VHA13_03670 [Gammaproteobacteria bacterium]|nr:hypothetical protein [Gammaproteobacteria bacterium]